MAGTQGTMSAYDTETIEIEGFWLSDDISKLPLQPWTNCFCKHKAKIYLNLVKAILFEVFFWGGCFVLLFFFLSEPYLNPHGTLEISGWREKLEKAFWSRTFSHIGMGQSSSS